jgi:paraquat-inducible protein A
MSFNPEAGADRPAHGVPESGAMAFEAPRRTVDCPNCGLIQRGPDCRRHEVTYCCRCKTPFSHRTWKSLDATLACSVAVLVLLIPAMFEPFLTTSAFSATRTSILPMSAQFLWLEGWPFLAGVVSLFVLIFPALRFAALTAVLVTLRRDSRPHWLGRIFRYANALQTWAMLDVFLLGMGVAYARLHASLTVTLDVGGACFAIATVLTLIARASLDKALVWRMIAPDEAPSALTVRPAQTIMCLSCELLVPHDHEGLPCPRCAAIVRGRRIESVSRATALLLAAMVLYFPANLYPIATIPIDITPTAYTVIGGVVDLAKSHLIGLALLVFCASFTIPLLKMAGLAWCIVSVVRRSDKNLVGKTRVYRLIEEIGRWSMVDPLTIACFIPVLHFNGLIDGRAEPAATPFAAVVILTTLAVKFFDPRLMWDVVSERT